MILLIAHSMKRAQYYAKEKNLKHSEFRYISKLEDILGYSCYTAKVIFLDKWYENWKLEERNRLIEAIKSYQFSYSYEEDY